jgi:energy-coupling factor transporter transmembrane protein EcfT
MDLSSVSVRGETQLVKHPISRLHPATKLLGAALLLYQSIAYHSFTALAFPALALLVGLVLSRCSLREYVRGLKYLTLVFLIIFLWPVLTVHDHAQGLSEGAVSTLKLLLIYSIGVVLARSATRWEVAAALEKALSPFSRLRQIPLMLAVTLGLLPVLVETARKVWASFAGRARGSSSTVWYMWRHAPLLLGALFAHSLERAERLSRAMVARHFRGRLGPRSVRAKQPFSYADGLCCAVLTILFCLPFLI